MDTLVNLHKQDVDLLVKIQVNPYSPFMRDLHYTHIKNYVKGFMYTLGNLDYLVTVRGNYFITSPYLMWTIELDDGTYISEYHVDKQNLVNLTKEINEGDIIVSTKELTFAHGFSVPYEVFKSNKWEMPKIVIE
ncbi:hypothetical protein SJAV_04820 [Sulfurisphaera javensis]|uniref:Uncharacterized protein n=1 Tax=Sulfurisphaera javensis TaxID=2049879 RepID=A0AAT9GNS3_9CREN